MIHIVSCGADAHFFDFTMIALKSFLKFNPNWEVYIMDVGFTPNQVEILKKIPQVFQVEQCPRSPIVKINRRISVNMPTARCKLAAFSKFSNDNTVVLHLDVDTVTLGNIDALVNEFLDFKSPIGMTLENDPRYVHFPVFKQWHKGIPKAIFPNKLKWRLRFTFNAGIILVTGEEGRKIGEKSIRLYDVLKHKAVNAEQTILNSIIYDKKIRFFSIPIHYNCFIKENFLKKSGIPYLDAVELDGKQVFIRHFSFINKPDLVKFKDNLLCFYNK